MRSKIFITTAVLCLSFLTMAFTIKSEPKFLFDRVPYNALSKPAQKQIDCLAENIYFEAGHEPHEGQMAVALVTLNRLVSGNYAGDVCGVVKQKTNVSGKTVCQFSWVCDATFTSRRLTIKNTEMYNDIRDLAVYVFLNYENITDLTHGATYYHADYVNPGWRLPKTTKIGRHIFYKSKHDHHKLENKEIKI